MTSQDTNKKEFEVRYAPGNIGLSNNEEATRFYVWAFGDIKETKLLNRTHMNSWNKLHGNLLMLEANNAIANDLPVMVYLWRQSLKHAQSAREGYIHLTCNKCTYINLVSRTQIREPGYDLSCPMCIREPR